MVTRTAPQRRAEARADRVERMAACPTHRVLGLLGERWVSLVLKELADGSRRHSELARAIAGASQKMLTQTLRGLERDGLVSRTVTPSVPVRVDYALTPLGRGLLPIMHAVTDWAETHIGDIDTARAAADSRRK
jgi:DNA-binding HxlR family transcriptional regulator